MSEEIKKEINLLKSKVLAVLDKYKFRRTNLFINYRTLNVRESDNSDYSCRTNRMNYNGNRDECIHEMFHLASNRNRLVDGICIRQSNGELFGTGLNEGITDMFASMAGSNKVSYPFERACALAITDISGMHIMRDYFDNNGVSFFKRFNTSFVEFARELDKYNHMMREIDTLYRINGYKLDKVSKRKVNLIRENAGSQLGITYMALEDFLETLGFDYRQILDDRMSESDVLDLFKAFDINLDDYKTMEL